LHITIGIPQEVKADLSEPSIGLFKKNSLEFMPMRKGKTEVSEITAKTASSGTAIWLILTTDSHL
jgi:hypothetical protein